MFDLPTFLLIATTFFLAGTVKGVVGMGLPTVCLALLTVVLDMPSAMALMLVPSLATNLWQGLVGGELRMVIASCWRFLLPATVLVIPAGMLLRSADLELLSALLGVVLVLYGAINLAGFRFELEPQQKRWAGPLFGALNGVLTGLTGSFVVPGVLYLQACGLNRQQLMQAMGMLFSLSTLALAVALGSNGMLGLELGLISAAGLVPAIVGMVCGQRLRRHLSDRLFRQLFFSSLLVIGGSIITRGLL